MQTTEQVEGAESPAQTRPKRSRTGCLTCRTRRRKCDEEKPKCQNCISKGFECQYPATFQILGKNNFTPEVPSSGKYRSVRFVSDNGEKQHDRQNEVEDSHEGQVNNTSAVVLGSSPQDAENRETGAQHAQAIVPTVSSPSIDSYEFALHGLLALGTGISTGLNNEVQFSPGAGSADSLSIPTARDEADMAHVQQTLDEFSTERAIENHSVSSWQTIDVPGNTRFGEPPHHRVLELLNHYRYNIAPWLDICDMNQFFGCEALQLSTESTSIRYGLLALAEASLHASHNEQSTNIALIADICRQRERELEPAHSALLDVLTVSRSVCADISKFWAQEEEVMFRNHILEMLLPEVSNRSLASSIYWMLTRLQLSVALMCSFPCRIPLPYLAITPPTFFAGGNADHVYQYSHDAVALCVDAAMFCQGGEDKWLQQRYGQSRVEVWGLLVRGFELWFSNRLQDFQAVVELYPRDGWRSEDEFPTIVFTSGAAILANQLCHTGMLLLLQNKPRFAGRTNLNPSFMSTLWHTHRIYGIAINNDRRECWDPCLLASLLLAARTATHISQHTTIINTLERVQILTGWDVSHDLNNLKNEWRLAEGW